MNDLVQPGKGEEIIEDEPKVSARTQSRRVALQALYQWQMTNNSPIEIMRYFQENGFLGDLDFDLFKELLENIIELHEEVDANYAEFLDRKVERLDPVERAILRIGSYELQHQIATPYKAVINESVELAKRFGAEESHKFINGVLDKVAKQLRTAEM
ncbi:transcription antitermination factor NusB [Thiomicrorhabdus indica]|uniref:transcription antitermination factor NusB n=1 Tax=Thiomicrorhabdus indica TaxID=2267253 RepID=UPI00102D7788|nr:transcription antitermination factor NusB [Thiomicrorhabdus indica]